LKSAQNVPGLHANSSSLLTSANEFLRDVRSLAYRPYLPTLGQTLSCGFDAVQVVLGRIR